MRSDFYFDFKILKAQKYWRKKNHIKTWQLLYVGYLIIYERELLFLPFLSEI